MKFKDLAVGEKFILIFNYETIQNIKEEKEVLIKVEDKNAKHGSTISLMDGEAVGVSPNTPVIRIKLSGRREEW